VAQQRKRTGKVRNEEAPKRAAKGASGASRTRQRRSGADEDDQPRSSVRRPSSSGPPTIVVILGGLVVLGALLYGFKSGASGGAGADTNIAAAKRVMSKGDSLESVETKLRIAAADPDLTTEQAQEIATIRAELVILQAEIMLKAHNMVGTKYLSKKMIKYADKNLAGDPDHAIARVFMERCVIFRERWPEHPDMDWVDRNEARFASTVDLGVPPTWSDLSWKLDRLVLGSPKEYGDAFEAVDSFITTGSESDKTLAQNRRKLMLDERAAYFEDRMKQAAFELDTNSDKAECVRLLVDGIVYMGDPAMASEAAKYLLNMDNAVGHLRGYRNDRPLIWGSLSAQPSIAALIQSTPDF
jgi:hypothetical protein